MATPQELLERVLAEARDYEEFDAEMRSNPHDPWRLAVELLARPDLVPFLADVVHARGPGARWAVSALQALGSAGHAAAAVLEECGETLALFAVDESRARALGLHKGMGRGADGRTTRSAIARYVLRSRDPERVRSHFAELLRDDDPGVVRFALGHRRIDDYGNLDRHLVAHPESAPLDELRVLTSHANSLIALGAAGLLTLVHLPDDAAQALAVFVKHRAGPPLLRAVPVDWLAPLPGSVALFDLDLAAQDVFALVQRRRCSGLSSPIDRVREVALRAIEEGDGAGARIVAELRDPLFIDALIEGGLSPRNARTFDITAGRDAIENALRVLGDPAIAALRAHAEKSHPRSVAAMMLADLTRFPDRPRPSPSTAYADQLFVEGVLENSGSAPSSFACYAAYAAERPHDAYTAYQLAWIDRAFGSPITGPRLDWLAQLGASEPLLQQLGMRPSAVVSGMRGIVANSSNKAADAALCARAAAAGVPSVAAKYTADAAEQSRLRAAAIAHLERVRAGCRA